MPRLLYCTLPVSDSRVLPVDGEIIGKPIDIVNRQTDNFCYNEKTRAQAGSNSITR
jgi:hypothetical protein